MALFESTEKAYGMICVWNVNPINTNEMSVYVQIIRYFVGAIVCYSIYYYYSSVIHCIHSVPYPKSTIDQSLEINTANKIYIKQICMFHIVHSLLFGFCARMHSWIRNKTVRSVSSRTHIKNEYLKFEIVRRIKSYALNRDRSMSWRSICTKMHTNDARKEWKR